MSLPRPGPPEELVQQRRRPVAQPSRPLFHAAQGGRAQETQQLVVVDADDRDLLRHAEVVGPARFEDVPAEVVVRGHDADRLRQPPQPLTQPVLGRRPFVRGTAAVAKDGARAALPSHVLDERVLALL